MKKLSVAVTGLMLWAAPLLTTASWAQDGPTTFLAAQTETEYLARDHLIGAKVHGSEGTVIGDVEDLIVNDENTIVGVVLGTGGYFGFAEKNVAVALASLKFEEMDGKLTVSLPDVTAETIAAAPAFKRQKPPKSLLERAKEKAIELGDKTTASTKDAMERAKPAIDSAKESAKQAYDKAKEAVSGAVDSATEPPAESTEDAPPVTEPSPPAATEPPSPAPDTSEQPATSGP